MKSLLKLAAFIAVLSGTCYAACVEGLAPTETTRAGIPKPAIQSCDWGLATNTNWDIIDSSACLQDVDNSFTGSNTFSGNPLLLTGQNAIRFYDSSSHYIELKSPSSVTTTSLSLPTSDGTSNQVLGTTGSGQLQWVTQSGGGTSSLAVTTGTSVGFYSTNQSSPTRVVNFRANQFNVPFTTNATAYIELNQSTVTLQGNTFNGASQLVKLDASSKLPVVDGSQLTNLVFSGVLTGGATSYWNVPSTGTFPANRYGIRASTITTSTITVSGLSAGQCVQTGAGGILSTSGSACPASNVVYNQSTLQSATTVYVSSMAVTGQINNVGVFSSMYDGSSSSQMSFYSDAAKTDLCGYVYGGGLTFGDTSGVCPGSLTLSGGTGNGLSSLSPTTLTFGNAGTIDWNSGVDQGGTVDLHLNREQAGILGLYSRSDQPGAGLRFYGDTNNAHSVTLKASASSITNSTYTLPTSMPGSSQYLQSDSSGNMAWVSGAGLGDAVLASTQAFTGTNTFRSSTTFSGQVNISSSVLLSGGGVKFIRQIVPFSIATSSTNATQNYIFSTVSASITPLSASSTIYIYASVSVAGSINTVTPGTLVGIDLRWLRGTSTTLSDTFTFGQAFGFNSQVASLTDAQQGTVAMFDYDVPNTTSATSYNLQFRNSQGTGQVFLNTATLLSSVNSETSGFLIEVGN